MADEMHDWLLSPLSIEEADLENSYDGVPYGFENGKWQTLRAIILADSEAQLWSFCSPPETWTTFPRRGMEGFAIVKNGKIIDFLLTALS